MFVCLFACLVVVVAAEIVAEAAAAATVKYDFVGLYFAIVMFISEIVLNYNKLYPHILTHTLSTTEHWELRNFEMKTFAVAYERLNRIGMC